jgi:hypothetical protein
VRGFVIVGTRVAINQPSPSPSPCRGRGDPYARGELDPPMQRYWPSGVVTSVPAGGLNSKVDGETGARVWLE